MADGAAGVGADTADAVGVADGVVGVADGVAVWLGCGAVREAGGAGIVMDAGGSGAAGAAGVAGMGCLGPDKI